MSAAARARIARENFLKQQDDEINAFRENAERAATERNKKILQILKDTRRPDEALNRQKKLTGTEHC